MVPMLNNDILSDYTVQQLLLDRDLPPDDSLILVQDPSLVDPRKSALDLAMAPMVSMRFGKDPTLGMAYGRGRGYAFIRPTVLKKIFFGIDLAGLEIRNWRGLVRAIELAGYKVEQVPFIGGSL